MSIICPTVLAETPDIYAEQLAKIATFAKRVQVDLVDGDFAPSHTIYPSRVYIPENLQVDIHLMFRYPVKEVMDLISLRPHMVILHAEAEGDIAHNLHEFQDVGIKAGVALLPESHPEYIPEIIKQADHVLLFGGMLGSFGGHADLAQLEKITAIRQINPSVEIGWDGGANAANIAKIAAAGVDVINVGSAIQKAPDAAAAYAQLLSLLPAQEQKVVQ
jgi:ribulose-phosphate 3-epimerase